LWKTLAFTFGPKPKPTQLARVDAFNGVSAGHGHLTGVKAVVAA
jgi:hypothetical protein